MTELEISTDLTMVIPITLDGKSPVKQYTWKTRTKPRKPEISGIEDEDAFDGN